MVMLPPPTGEGIGRDVAVFGQDADNEPSGRIDRDVATIAPCLSSACRRRDQAIAPQQHELICPQDDVTALPRGGCR